MHKFGIVLGYIAFLMVLALALSTTYGPWPLTPNGVYACLYIILAVSISSAVLVVKYHNREPQGSPTGR